MPDLDLQADQLLDYCRVKGVPATPENLRQAYRTLSKTPHQMFVESLQVEYRLLGRLAENYRRFSNVLGSME